MSILVRKATGEDESFAPDKLRNSLVSAGASAKAIDEVISDISDWIYSGVTTKKIYLRAFALLKRMKGVASLRYKLKQAMMELGPTGYPFEKFTGQIFERQGYEVKVGQIMEGMCITHEMDVIATNQKTQQLVECKYSHYQGKYITVQVPLYVRSRINDIIDKYKERGLYKDLIFTGWVVTNTRFSSDSESYAKCSGLKLMGWDYPAGNSLKEIIENERLYPVTVLSQLTNKEKQRLIEQGIVSCPQLLDNLDVLDIIEFRQSRSTGLVKELNDIIELPLI